MDILATTLAGTSSLRPRFANGTPPAVADDSVLTAPNEDTHADFATELAEEQSAVASAAPNTEAQASSAAGLDPRVSAELDTQDAEPTGLASSTEAVALSAFFTGFAPVTTPEAASAFIADTGLVPTFTKDAAMAAASPTTAPSAETTAPTLATEANGEVKATLTNQLAPMSSPVAAHGTSDTTQREASSAGALNSVPTNSDAAVTQQPGLETQVVADQARSASAEQTAAGTAQVAPKVVAQTAQRKLTDVADDAEHETAALPKAAASNGASKSAAINPPLSAAPLEGMENLGEVDGPRNPVLAAADVGGAEVDSSQGTSQQSSEFAGSVRGTLQDAPSSSSQPEAQTPLAALPQKSPTSAQGASSVAAQDNLRSLTPVERQYAVEEVRMHLSAARPEVSIILDPPALGEVHVRLVVQQGAVKAEIRAEHGDVADSLRAEIVTLRNALEDAGLAVADVQVKTRDDGRTPTDANASHQRFLRDARQDAQDQRRREAAHSSHTATAGDPRPMSRPNRAPARTAANSALDVTI
jgi:flagellar hook-length control protein FliK